MRKKDKKAVEDQELADTNEWIAAIQDDETPVSTEPSTEMPKEGKAPKPGKYQARHKKR